MNAMVACTVEADEGPNRQEECEERCSEPVERIESFCFAMGGDEDACVRRRIRAEQSCVRDC